MRLSGVLTVPTVPMEKEAVVTHDLPKVNRTFKLAALQSGWSGSWSA